MVYIIYISFCGAKSCACADIAYYSESTGKCNPCAIEFYRNTGQKCTKPGDWFLIFADWSLNAEGIPLGLCLDESDALKHGLGLGVERINLRVQLGDALFTGEGSELADDPAANVLVLKGLCDDNVDFTAGLQAHIAAQGGNRSPWVFK